MDDIIENVLPQALMMGVDYNLFWTLNPKSLSPFTKAFNLKIQYDDRLAWQHGKYITVAVASVLDNKTKYPTKPFLEDMDNLIEETPQDRMNRIKEKMLMNMVVINQKFTNGGELSSGQ